MLAKEDETTVLLPLFEQTLESQCDRCVCFLQIIHDAPLISRPNLW